MPLDNLINNLENFEGDLQRVLSDTSEIVSADYVAQLLRRVQFKGENSNKQKLGTYAKATSTIKKKKGQSSQFVNLTDTFQMLGSIDLVQKQSIKNGIKLKIAPSDTVRKGITNKGIMAVQEKRYGDIMDPTTEELANMTETYVFAITKLIEEL